MTYSIVARDPATGSLGVAVQTCMFAAGASVPWARAGVGAVASQAMAEPAYGLRCLAVLQDGGAAPDALARATAQDGAALVRQVAVVGADGSAAAMTGEWCIDHAGHQVGDGFVVQANMAASPDVWPAMAAAYRDDPGTSFPLRLLAALDAGQEAGGDARGLMSAAILVVDGKPSDPWAGVQLDLRVDRSPDPLAELRELMRASRAYRAFHEAVAALSQGDAAQALAHATAGLDLLPGEENLRFIRAGALAATGDAETARAEMMALSAARPSWEVVFSGFVAKGLMTLP